ncbi:branched-chain amino acid ABC transporter permease [uncultured Sphaerochaeta sp.]|uniref:branched-chain amino acid ABC transporter permease n=1 Tax=uncultured Sphaerochaeta sp. TaxID=886478 RepID=UPI002A0A4B87|nr:branched-chain amino acid ABC transporter permease [uncultured Sphaerochaeta sp.]
MSLSYFLQTLVTGMASGMVSYMMVSGMSLIISGMNMVNFGQGAFFVLGTYLTYTLAAQLNFFVALLIVPVIVGCFGWFVERAVRPLFGKNMLYIMLLTFGVAYMVCDLIVMFWGYSIRLLVLPRILKGSIAFFGIRFPIYYIFMIVVGSVIAFAFWFMINKTKLGMLMRAIINDREMVACLGVNVNRLFSIMFMIGMGIAGLGGVVNAPITGMSPKEGLSVFGNIMPILLIGGMRNMNGCLPAALMVGLANAFGVIVFPQYYNLIPAALMVVCMFIRPQGIFTKKEAS